MAELFPDVSNFEDDLLETEDLEARFRAERNEINQREEEVLRQQALAGQVSTEPVQPGREADLAVDQPTGPEEAGPGFVSEAIKATLGGILGEIRDIVVNVDQLTDAALTGLGVLEEDEKDGILGLQELLPDVAEPETVAGQVVRGLVEFGTGFLLFGALGRAAGLTNKFLISTVAGTAEAGFGKGEDEGRLTDFVTQLAPSLEDDRIVGGLVQFLKTSEDEGALERFGKDVLEDVLVGLGGEALVLVGRRFIEGVRGGAIRQALANQEGGVRFPGDRDPIQGPLTPEQAALQLRRESEEGGELIERLQAQTAGESPEDILRRLRRDPDDLSGTAAVEDATAAASTGVSNRVNKEVEKNIDADPELIATAIDGNYDIEAIKKITGKGSMKDPLNKVVANFTVERSRELGAAAQDALDNGFNTANRQAVYSGLQEMIEGYRVFEKRIRQGRQTITAQTVADTGRPSRWTRNLIRKIENGEAGIDEDTLFREMAENPARVAQSFAGASRNFKELTGDLITELFYSGALSAPGTLIRAMLGAPVLFGYETTAKLVGGVVSLNRTGLLGEAAADLQGAFGGILDGIRVMAKSVGEEKVAESALSIRGIDRSNAFTIASDNFGFSGRIGSALNVIGKGVRMPTRILGAIDKGTGVVVTRMVLHREAFQRAQGAVLESGARGNVAKVIHRDTYNRVLNTELTPELLEKARLETRRLTLTNELQPGFVNEFNNLINSNPYSRIIVPFVRVSSNAMIQSIEKSPALAFIQKSQRNIMRSGNGDEIARLAGRQVLGGVVAGTAAYLTLQGFMTGAAPQNPTVRQSWILSGRKEYSFHFQQPNGEVVSFQYARLGEPIGFLLGMVADLTYGLAHIDDNLREADNPEDRSVMTEAANVIMMSFAQNLTKRTFMQSVVDFAQASTDPIKFASKFAATTATTVVIPLGGLFRGIDREQYPELEEVNGFMDRVYSRVPWHNPRLRPKRNLFGEPMEYQPGFGAAFINPELIFGIPAGAADIFSPVVIGSVDPEDPAVRIGNVIRENRLVPEGVSVPSTFRGIKFTEEEKDFIAVRRGEIEINGKNMKQTLFELIEDETFQAQVSGRDGIQEAMMSRVINAFNRAAVFEAIENFSPIMDRVEERVRRITGT